VQSAGGQPRGQRRRSGRPGGDPRLARAGRGGRPEGRFQIVRFHKEGGLGEVYLARDSQLHRIVALKRIKHTKAADKDKRDRFVVEAEITGRLEHPCIVPVYSLGTFDDGRPFYAMRFIRGDNLEAAIDQFHQDEQAGRDAGARTLALQKLRRRFLDVCNAIAYAHSRGVVHRDLKPGNIMLGQYGETLVVDWGLAKSVGRPEPVPASATLDDRTLVPESGSDRRRSVQGDLLGTPAYMSPEQAAGRIDQLGPASDVYSLGATLYCLLTGSAPFEKQAPAELLPKVQQGAFAPPRQVQGWIDPALEAICLKAMKTDPAQRYATPRALADDVEHWLADEPVGAYKEPLVTRAKRWMRQHPSRVTAAAVLLLSTVVGLTIGTLLLNRKNFLLAQQTQRAENASKEADRQRQNADAMFRDARSAVDTYLTNVSEEDLLKEDRLKPSRKKLLTLALNYYEDFIKQRTNDPTVRRDLAKAYFRASSINWFITGADGEGQAQATRAAQLYGEMIAESPGDRALRRELAEGHWRLSTLQYHGGQTKASLASVNQVIELQERLWAEDLSDYRLGRSLAGSYSWRAMQKNNLGDRERAAADTLQSVVILEKLLSTSPPEEKDATLRMLAYTYYRSFDLRICLKAVDILRDLASTPKTDVLDLDAHERPVEWDLRGALYNAGNDLINIGCPAKGEPLMREAAAIVRKGVSQNPQVDNYLHYLQSPLGELGESLFLQGKRQGALRALEEAVVIKDELQRRRVLLGGTWLWNHAWYTFLLGCLEGESGDFTGDSPISSCRCGKCKSCEPRTKAWEKTIPWSRTSASGFVRRSPNSASFRAGSAATSGLPSRSRYSRIARRFRSERRRAPIGSTASSSWRWADRLPCWRACCWNPDARRRRSQSSMGFSPGRSG